MSTHKKPALGRGLSSLLAQAEATYAEGNQASLQRLRLEQLVPGKFQPRRHFDGESLAQLAQSIRQRGVLQPILVRALDNGQYEIIAGERRWRAAQLAESRDLPVIVETLTDAQALEIGLIENLQREDLNALEEAGAYQRLIAEFGHTQQELAEVIGKSRSHVANTLRLLTLPPAVQALVEKGSLSAGHARTLVGNEAAEALAEKIIAEALSVRDAERLASAAPARIGKPAAKRSADLLAIEADLSQRLGLRVQVQANGQSGKLTLFFSNLDQFDELLAKLG
jgi:ParB family chromosome partitioning protein